MVRPLTSECCSNSARSQVGFTLIEMCIATAVLVGGLVAIVGISVHISRANAVSNTKSVLTTYGQDQVDALRAATWNKNTEDAAITVGGSLTSSEEDHFVTVADTAIGDLVVRWQVTEGPGTTGDIRTITLRVTQFKSSPWVRDGFTMTTTVVKR